MAWIESHQELAHHPKVARLAHMLDVTVPAALGHLHCLWWWCLSYADDGDLAQFDAFEVAHGAQWDGDPEHFVKCLEECGWLDDGVVHDWHDYAGKLVERRRADAERKRQARSEKSAARPPDVQKDGVRRQPTNTTEPNTTNHAELLKVRSVEKAERLKQQGRRIESISRYAATLAKNDEDLIADVQREWEHRDCDCDRGWVVFHPQAGGTTRAECTKGGQGGR